MESQGWLCSSCDRTQASWFCLCHQSAVLLCQDCFPTHLSKNPGRSHPSHPVEAFPYRAIPGYFDRLAQRSTVVQQACEELRKNLTVVDGAMWELYEKAKCAIDAVELYVRTEMEKLVSLRAELQADIEAAVVEAMKTLYQEEPKLNTRYGRLLRTLGTDWTPLELFTYQIETVDPLNILRLKYSVRPHDSAVQDIARHILPQIHGNSLKLYDFLTGQTTIAELTVSFTSSNIFCLLNEDTVLSIGGWSESNVTSHTCLLELSTAKVTLLHDMKTSRIMPGIIKHGSFVYVFGGRNPMALKACEKFAIDHQVWSEIPDMQHQRSYFFPSAFGDDIYLPDVYQSHRVLEVFNVSAELFKALSVPIPSIFRSSSVSFIIDGELIIICDSGQIGKWRINTEETIRVSEINLSGIDTVSNIPPMRNGRQVFWVLSASGNLVKFDIDSQVVSH